MNNSYISNFQTTAELAEFSATTQFMKPHVSFTKSDGKVHYFQDAHNGHAYVDLGLPSGLKWATMNVGANSETDYGLYFAWGDTSGYTSDQVGMGEGQKYFGWFDYKYGNGTGSPGATGMTKYNTTDNKKVLDLEDDAAHANMGGSWRMPTEAEFQELIDNTNNEQAVINDVLGYKFTSKSNSSNYIFFPIAGRLIDGYYSYDDGIYWSSSLDSSNVTEGRYLYFNYSVDLFNNSRYMGFPVRGVVS